MSRRILSIAVASLALAAAGCGSSDDSSGDSASTPASSSSGGAVAIKIHNIKFDPKTVTVKVGQTITWTNDDPLVHDVTATSGADFKSDKLRKGDTFEFTAEQAGTIDYECTIHPGQTGSVTVTS